MKRISTFAVFAVALVLGSFAVSDAGMLDNIRRFLEVKEWNGDSSGDKGYNPIHEAYNIGTDDSPAYAILSGITFGTSGQGLTDDIAGDGDEVPDPVNPDDDNGDGRTDIINGGAVAKVYAWGAGPWGECDTECGSGHRSREIFCINMSNKRVPDDLCDPGASHPATSEECVGACAPLQHGLGAMISRCGRIWFGFHQSKGGVGQWPNPVLTPLSNGMYRMQGKDTVQGQGIGISVGPCSYPPGRYRVSITGGSECAGDDWKLGLVIPGGLYEPKIWNQRPVVREFNASNGFSNAWFSVKCMHGSGPSTDLGRSHDYTFNIELERIGPPS